MDSGREPPLDRPSWEQCMVLYSEAKSRSRDSAGGMDLEEDTRMHLRKLYAQRAHQMKITAKHPSYHTVPPFHHGGRRAPAADAGGHGKAMAALRERLSQQAKTQFLHREEEALMDFDDLTALEELLQRADAPQQNGGSSGSGGGGLDYDAFLAVKARAPARARKYFEARTFLKLQAGGAAAGRVSGPLLFKHVYGALCLQKARVTLHYYDAEGRGALRETDVENYVYDLIPTVPALRAVPESFHPFYVFTAVRRFMFFLDPRRTGRIPVARLIRSRVMDDLLELGMAVGGGGGEGEEPAGDMSGNWFSAENALRVYTEYLELDTDQNGMLSREELRAYGASRNPPMHLTPAFVNAVFEEIVTYKVAAAPQDDGTAAADAAAGIGSGGGGDSGGSAQPGEMDYKTFLDFVLAIENRATPQGLAYLWRPLDVRRRGALDAFALSYFLRDIAERLRAGGLDPPVVEDVVNEVFDMARPADPSRGITPRDLLRCGAAHTVVSMLIDANAFWAYDNRESAAVEGDDEAEAAEAAAAAEGEAAAAAQQAEGAGEGDDGGGGGSDGSDGGGGGEAPLP